ncbi:MAG: hypothetical protein IT384_09810 [Deltaproteobacteria bacterium]|nr:hypothetical protein [Deltaproteobacteria bacterium]
MGRACLLVLASGIGCAASNEVQFVPSPPVGGAPSAILAFLRGEERIELRAIDLRATPLGETPLRVPFDQPPDRIELLLFSESLGELRLAPGPLTESPEGEVLPTPLSVLSVGLDSSAEWEGQGEMSRSLRSARVPRLDPCAALERYRLEETEVAADPADQLRFAVKLDESSLLMSLPSGLYRVTSGGDVERLPGSIPTASIAVAAYRALDGELWFADAHGGVVRGRDLSSLAGVPRAEALPGATRAVLDGTRTGTSADEILYFVQSSEATLLQRFAAGAWAVVAQIEGAPREAEMAWIGPGQVVTLGHELESGILIHANGRSVRSEVPFAHPGQHLSSVRFIAGVGAVFWSDFGALTLLEADGTFQPLASVLLDTIYDAAPLGRGFIFGGWSDRYAQYVDGRFCPVASLGNRARRSIVPMAGGYALPRRERAREVPPPAGVGWLRAP